MVVKLPQTRPKSILLCKNPPLPDASPGYPNPLTVKFLRLIHSGNPGSAPAAYADVALSGRVAGPLAGPSLHVPLATPSNP